ncbi:hypothetical protein F4815DRAFT_219454 [Daldinia loculata]|nr:hypothetical protein F4815DRAFT_219454 [Daldinia loculata]
MGKIARIAGGVARILMLFIYTIIYLYLLISLPIRGRIACNLGRIFADFLIQLTIFFQKIWMRFRKVIKVNAKKGKVLPDTYPVFAILA